MSIVMSPSGILTEMTIWRTQLIAIFRLNIQLIVLFNLIDFQIISERFF